MSEGGIQQTPDRCQTDGCRREASVIISAMNPQDINDPQERALCGPCYDVFQWCAGIPYGDHVETPINRPSSDTANTDSERGSDD